MLKPLHWLRSRIGTSSSTSCWSRERKAGSTKDSDPSITIYNQGVELMLALEKLSLQLAKDLAEVIKTGKEEDRFYGLSSKIRG